MTIKRNQYIPEELEKTGKIRLNKKRYQWKGVGCLKKDPKYIWTTDCLIRLSFLGIP